MQLVHSTVLADWAKNNNSDIFCTPNVDKQWLSKGELSELVTKHVYFERKTTLYGCRNYKIGDRSQGRQEGTLFNSYYTKV